MRWKFTHASVTGTSHTERGEDGQDFSRAGTVQIGESEYFIGIAADGAGSTSDGGRGAEIACRTLFEKIVATIRDIPVLSDISDEDIRGWVTAARDAIATTSQDDGKRLREYASTILGSVAGNDHAIYFQIGDGAIVAGTGQGYETIFWPEQGEYANSTYFITDEQYMALLSLRHAEAPEEIALFTDGLQTLVLSFSEKRAHAGFFRPLFDALRLSGDEVPGFSAQLETFLSRDDISRRSDDDKTLVLAVRTG